MRAVCDVHALISTKGKCYGNSKSRAEQHRTEEREREKGEQRKRATSEAEITAASAELRKKIKAFRIRVLTKCALRRCRGGSCCRFLL